MLANTLPYMPVGRPPRGRRSGRRQARGARSRCATRRGGSSSAPTTACSLPAAERSAGSPRRTSSRTRSTRSSRLAHVPRPRPVRAGRRASRARRRARRARPAARSRTRSCGSTSRSRESAETAIAGTVLYVDRFGNVALNLTREHLERGRHRPGHAGRARARRRALLRRRGADVRRRAAGRLILYEDSYRNMSVAINGGNAAEMLHARRGAVDQDQRRPPVTCVKAQRL